MHTWGLDNGDGRLGHDNAGDEIGATGAARAAAAGTTTTTAASTVAATVAATAAAATSIASSAIEGEELTFSALTPPAESAARALARSEDVTDQSPVEMSAAVAAREEAESLPVPVAQDVDTHTGNIGGSFWLKAPIRVMALLRHRVMQVSFFGRRLLLIFS